MRLTGHQLLNAYDRAVSAHSGSVRDRIVGLIRQYEQQVFAQFSVEDAKSTRQTSLAEALQVFIKLVIPWRIRPAQQEQLAQLRNQMDLARSVPLEIPEADGLDPSLFTA
jgi:hypothetical protein